MTELMNSKEAKRKIVLGYLRIEEACTWGARREVGAAKVIFRIVSGVDEPSPKDWLLLLDYVFGLLVLAAQCLSKRCRRGMDFEP